MNEAAWRSLHVAYFDRNMDDLICDGVEPLLAATTEPSYYLRHWRRGPHLRINFHVDEDAFTRRIRPKAIELMTLSLGRHPSTEHLDKARLLKLYQRRAQLDGDHGPLTPWYEDNTIYDAPYEPPVIGFAGPAAATFLEDFYCATTDLAVDVSRRARLGQSRFGALFDVWIATAHSLAGGYEHSWTSYRSSADKFRYAAGDDGKYVTGWDLRFEKQRDRLTAQVEAVVQTIDQGTGRSTIAATWVAVMRQFYHRARELVESDGITFPLPAPDSGSFALAELTSPFHQALMTNEGWYNQTGNVHFAAYRVMLALTYAHGGRVGLSLVERYFLCHLAASAMEAIAGVDSVALVQSPNYFQHFFEG